MRNIDWLRAELNKIVGEGTEQVPGLGVMLYRDGQRKFSYCTGKARFSDNYAFKKNTFFRIASISKQFTIFAVMKLQEEGRLSLDDDISRYLDFEVRHPDFQDIPITIKMLASHISGLRDGKIYSTAPASSLQALIYNEEDYHFSAAAEKPGEYFCYSNLNYGILGTIIEKVSGQRFDIYMEENIFKPLDIEAYYLPGNMPNDAFERLGIIYRKENEQGIWDENGKWYPKMDYYVQQPAKNSIFLQNPYCESFNGTFSLSDYIPGTNATSFAPQGGLRISLAGLSHVLEMLMNKGIYRGRRFLSQASVAEMMSGQWIYDKKNNNGDNCSGTLLNYGLGLYNIEGKSSARVCRDYEIDLVGHTGQAFGLLSGMFMIPGTKDGFIYIMNGTAIAEEDKRSLGRFSGNFVQEENVMNILCQGLLDCNYSAGVPTKDAFA